MYNNNKTRYFQQKHMKNKIKSKIQRANTNVIAEK